MRLREIFRFELLNQLRSVTPWFCFLVLLGFALWTTGTTVADADVYRNAPYFVVFDSVLAGVIWLMIAPSIAGEAAARDIHTRMHPLTFTAPLTRADYLGGRLLAAVSVNAVILLAVPAGLLLGQLLRTPTGMGPLLPAAYLTAYALVSLPFAAVVTAIQFSVATLARRAMAAYLASICLFGASLFALMAVATLLGRSELIRPLDLVGILSVADVGRTWTDVEKNTRLLGLDPLMLASRVVWLGIAAAALSFTYGRFRLAHVAEGTRREGGARRGPAPIPEPGGDAAESDPVGRSAPIVVPRVERSFGPATAARQALGIAGASFRTVALSRAGLVLMGLLALHVALSLPDAMELLGAPISPTTGRVLASITAPLRDVLTPLVLIPLLIAYYAGDLSWRERDAGLGDIADAAPVPQAAVFAGRFLGLGLAIAAWVLLLGAAGMLGQLAMGHTELEPGLYLTVLLGLQLPEYLLFACLALAVHALVNHRYLGLTLSVMALGFIGFAARLGLRHDLLVFSAGPRWSHSEMAGFGSSLAPWAWFKLYWAGWALLLAVAAVLLAVRGREEGLAARLRLARPRLTRPTGAALAAAVALIVGVGGLILHDSEARSASAFENPDLRAEYERRYGRLAGAPQPRLADVRLHVEIHPARHLADVRGSYLLVNRSGAAIDTLHLATAPAARTRELSLDRPAELLVADEELGHRSYLLGSPLQPGEALRLEFALRVAPRGLVGGERPVAANGTHLASAAWLPAIGYRQERELRSAGQRRSHGLPPRPFFRSLREAGAGEAVGAGAAAGAAASSDVDSAGEERHAFEAVVGTRADQVAVAPGALRRSWTEGGRRYFHYAADAPIGSEYALLSARYAVIDDEWNGVAIRILHHPGHTRNLDRMLRAVRASLEHYSAAFGPYPYRHLTLAQRPGVGGMHAHSALILFQEGFSLFEPGAGSPDIPFSVVAHEVAHQWWGSHLSPWRAEGNPVLAEGVAQYAAYQVVRESLGQEQLRRLIRSERVDAGGNARRRADVPLLRGTDAFHRYHRGPWALHGLSEYAGRERVDAALRRLQERHAAGELLTTLDLYGELRTAVPDTLHPLLHDLFAVNTLWELRTRTVAAERTDGGDWRVTLRILARKVTVDEAGRETELPMDDPVQIGVFARPAGGAHALSDPLYLEMHRIRSGEQVITLTVPREPARAGVDPHHLLPDPWPYDNVTRVAGSGEAVEVI